MILTIQGIDLQVEIAEGIKPVLEIHNKKLLRSVIEAVHYKVNDGITNDVVILNGEKEVSFASMVCIVESPLSVEVNTKKMVGKLYKRLEEGLNVNYDIKLQIMDYMNKISTMIDEESQSLMFPVTRSDDVSLVDLLKIFNYRIDCSITNILDKLYSFVDIIGEFRIYDLVLFLDISFYLEKEELGMFLSYMESKKILYLLIESERYPRISDETVYRIDDELFEFIQRGAD